MKFSGSLLPKEVKDSDLLDIVDCRSEILDLRLKT